MKFFFQSALNFGQNQRTLRIFFRVRWVLDQGGPLWKKFSKWVALVQGLTHFEKFFQSALPHLYHLWLISAYIPLCTYNRISFVWQFFSNIRLVWFSCQRLPFQRVDFFFFTINGGFSIKLRFCDNFYARLRFFA